MASLDILGAIGLTAGSAILVATLATIYPGTTPARLRLVIGFATWFVVLVALCALDVFRPVSGLGTVGLGIAVALPLIVMTCIAFGSSKGRQALLAVPLPVLIGVHAIRILGLYFLLLNVTGRLPAPFAPVAGGGDVFIGLTALPVAWAVSHDLAGAKPLALIWSLLGTLDLIAAIGLGVASAPDSPIRVFYGSPDTALMTTLPWMIIPAFIVPILFLLHLAAFVRLWPQGSDRVRSVLAT